MKKKLAIALSGGGSRGALEVGALRALFEAGFVPDLMTGTSIGAANAAFLAVRGLTIEGLENLEKVWRGTQVRELVPEHLWWQSMRTFIGRADGRSQQRIREFAIANGLAPELRFGDIRCVKLYFLATDLNAGGPVVFGLDPDESVLDAVLASMTLPPWMAPVQRGKQYMIDGGIVSNVPIETAIHQGATEVIALDILRMTETEMQAMHELGHFLSQINHALENRVLHLEMELAEAYGVPVRYICLTCDNPPPFWDFRHASKMIEHGYKVTREAITKWEQVKPHWWSRIPLHTMAEGFLEVLE